MDIRSLCAEMMPGQSGRVTYRPGQTPETAPTNWSQASVGSEPSYTAPVDNLGITQASEPVNSAPSWLFLEVLMIYRYSKKTSKSVHILNEETGKTFCKLENSTAGRKLTERSSVFPHGRRICSICEGMQSPTKRSKAKRVAPSANFYSSWEWAELRYEVLKKFGATCMLCGATAKTNKIIVDHIKPRALFPELELDFNNMQVLCDMCNRGKGRYDQTDWRDLHEDAAAHMKSITG